MKSLYLYHRIRIRLDFKSSQREYEHNLTGSEAVHRRFGVTYCLLFWEERMNQARNQEDEKKSDILLPASCRLLASFFFDTKNGGSTFLRNVVKMLPNYTASGYITPKTHQRLNSKTKHKHVSIFT
jgi:hypothetical protein